MRSEEWVLFIFCSPLCTIFLILDVGFQLVEVLPIPDDAVGLRIVQKRALQPLQLACIGRHKQHVAPSQQIFGAGHIQHHTAVYLAGHGEGDAGGEIGFDQAGDDIDRRALGRDDQMDADGAASAQADHVLLDLSGADIIRSAISSMMTTI